MINGSVLTDIISVFKAEALVTIDWYLDLCFASSKPRLCPFTLSWSCPAVKVNHS